MPSWSLGRGAKGAFPPGGAQGGLTEVYGPLAPGAALPGSQPLGHSPAQEERGRAVWPPGPAGRVGVLCLLPPGPLPLGHTPGPDHPLAPFPGSLPGNP